MKLVFLYGPPASGKYTIAKILSEKTGYKLFHNHLTVDLVKSIFEFGTPAYGALIEKLRIDIITHAAKENIPGLIFTFVYCIEHDGYDDIFVKKIIEAVESNKGEVTFIQIICKEEELLKRVNDTSRSQFKKITSKEFMEKFLKEHKTLSPIPFIDSLKIDTTNLTPEEAVKEITEHIS